MNARTCRIWIATAVALLLLGCASAPTTTGSSLAPAGQQSLGVALYPYVPRPDQFQQQLQQAWQARHPDVTLNFFTANQWDGGYNMDPPPGADLYVFDAIFLNYYRSAQWLVPLARAEIQNINDFLPYAINGVQSQESYYGIPMFGCTNMLFYWQDDHAMANAKTFSDLKNALGQCRYTSRIPPNIDGAMLDLSGGTTNACTYIDVTERITGQWPAPQPPPGQLYQPAIATMHTELQLASWDNATKDPPGQYDRSAWFSQGHGRAAVGFTESMSAMDPGALDRIDFKIMPLSDNSNRPLFYSDIIGLNKKSITPDKRALAVELANLLASTSVMVASLRPQGSVGPQYLMPTRPSIFAALAPQFPKYQKMQMVLSGVSPILFTLDASAKSWIASIKNPIKSASRQNFACGCDFPAGPIWGQQDAQAKCPMICATHGGWNGQWTTTVPGQMSVCGCKTCPVQ